MNAHTLPDIAPPLLAWYVAQARSLPWRDDPSPYRVWVSEIMLQQTRVEAVKPYFARFIAALPDIQSLAHVPDEQLLKLWEGLGYYARARNLKKAAQIVLREHDGRLPTTPAQLSTLPGIGPYTAGAIASIAYGYACPAVDGNVLRVVARLLATGENIAAPVVRKRIAALLQTRLPACPGDFNQALMELGALVCLPRTPKCALCPLRNLCRAYELGAPGAYPVKPPRAPRVVVPLTVLLLVRGDTLALRRRPPRGLLAGLWEPPTLDGHATPDQALAYVRELGLAPLAIEPLEPAQHIFTHRQWQMHAYRIEVAAGECDAALNWVAPPQLHSQYALPRAYAAYIQPFMQGQ